jgi:hypothetical protein
MASRIHAVGLMVSETEIFLEVDALEQFLHVGQRVDGDAFAADLAVAHRVVGVVAHEGGHVEVGGEPRLALLDQVLEALVGVLAGAEAGDLAHGPQPAAVHGGIGAAGEGIAPGQADVGEGVSAVSSAV